MIGRTAFRTTAFAMTVLAAACAPLQDFRPGSPGGSARPGGDPAACYAALKAEGVSFEPVRDQVPGGFCEVRGALTLTADLANPGLKMSPAQPMMTCPLAAALIKWRRRSVEPAALEMLGSTVVRLDHLGVYACRRVNGAAVGRPSAHARAAAIDIAAFQLKDGRRIVVKQDWNAGGLEAAFLRRVRKEACGLFRTVLSPDYNAAHADHLHLEEDESRVCS